ncbi:MAG: hypothetical protein QM770_14640 [Tepidisphaeraceae bacterium]
MEVRSKAVVAAWMSIGVLQGAVSAGVITANPAAEFTAAIGVDLNQTQSFTRISFVDENDPSQVYPEVYWFKYHADGNSRVRFDTYGSDFGSRGPSNSSSGGPVLGTYNSSQIAVYRANGAPVAISKGNVGLDGNPVPQFPMYTSNPNARWYTSQGLTELTFTPNPGTNPHWAASPTDPTPYTGWSAPGNEGNGQKYYTPYYPTNLNEYQAWNTALDTIVRDGNGQPVINPNTGQPYAQAGWRYYDHARLGPASSWNRFDVLAEGDYYIAVSSTRLTFQGDTYAEDVLRFPQVGALSGPLGTFQYYAPTGGLNSPYWGTITLNVTHMPLVDPAWAVNASGNWTVTTNWNGTAPGAPSSGGTFGPAITSPQTVTLNADRSVGRLTFNNANRYTIAGTNVLSLEDSSYTATIDVQAGSHVISAPVQPVSSVRFNIASGAKLSLSEFRSSTKLITKTGAGTLEVDKLQAVSLEVQAGTLKFTGTNIAGRTVTYRMESGASIDLGKGGMVFDYSTVAPMTMAVPSPTITAQIIAGQIFTSNAPLRVGFAEASALGLTSFLGQTGIDDTAFLIRATYGGDSNLDGTVNFSDLLILASNYSLSGKTWIHGDSNYDGTVNFNDLLLLAASYNQTVTGSFASDWCWPCRLYRNRRRPSRSAR